MSGPKRILLFAMTVFLAGGTVIFSHAQNSSGNHRRAAALPQSGNIEPVMVDVKNPAGSVIDLTYSLPAAGIKATGKQYNGEDLSEINVGNALQSGNEGEPVLPVIPVQVVIPSGYSLENLNVVSTKINQIKGTYRVRHGEAQTPLIPGAKPRTAIPLSRIYDLDNIYPSKVVELVNVQYKRGVAIAILKVHPIAYRPKSGSISNYTSISFELKMKKGGACSVLKSRPNMLKSSSLGLENPEALDTYTEGAAPLSGDSLTSLGICNPAQRFQYIIITADSIKNAVADYTVRDLIAQKRARGLSDTIITTEAIYANYTGVDNPEKIRNFIKDAYTNWGTDFVLLGGDANIVPLRFLYCNSDAGPDNIPSDLYYQCLDGNYNSNGDANWGEPTDGPGGTDVDLMSEVDIGRASAENKAEMSNFVYKTLAYENASESSPYLRKALMAGEYIGFGGVSDYASNTMEEIHQGSSAYGYTTAGFASCPLFLVDTLYDSPSYTWAASDLISRMNSGNYSIYNHLGHANETYDMKLYNADADALTNTNFFFVYSQGCDAGAIDVDCFAEHLTTSTRHGAFAVVLNARYGWGAASSTDGASQRFNRQFWNAYFGEYFSNLGTLNAKSHENNIWDVNGENIRWCMYETNLCGDPQTPMRGRVVGPSLAYSSNTISDVSGGNGDGLVNPGETVDLNLTLANVGTDSATGVTATISSTDPYVTMVNGSVTFGTIQCCGATKTGSVPVRFSVASSCPTPHTIALSCLIRDNRDSTWTSTFTITAYTSSQVSGYVRTLTGGNPVSGATVSFSGPVSGSVTTNASGYYMFGGIDGTYKVVACRNDYLPSDTQSVTLPPSASNINFQLARPVIAFSPGSIKDTLACGDSTTLPLMVSDGGDANLKFTINVRDTSGASLHTGNQKFNMTSVPFAPPLLKKIDNSATKSGDQLTLVNDKTIYSYAEKGAVNNLGFSNILVCEEVPDSFYYDRALNNLGLARTLVTTVASAETALSNGTRWDLVIINSYTNFIDTSFLTALNTYVANGGKLIFADWGMYNYTAHNLLKTLGISFVSDFTTPLSFASVDSSHAIFNYPNHIRNLTPTADQYNRDGEIVNVLSGSKQLAAFSGYPSSGAIVLNANGNCIFNGFQSVNFGGDNDTDGKLDIVELLENEISYLSGATTWLKANPVEGTVPAGGFCNIGITLNAAKLFGGSYYGSLDFTHNDPLKSNPVSVPCTLIVKGVKRLSVRPVSINFGNVWIGAKDTLSIVLTNIGNEATTVSSLTSNNGDFFANVPIPMTVPPLDSVSAKVVFSPSSLGPKSATFTITSNAEDNPTISFSCSGTAVPSPQISVTPSSFSRSLNGGDSTTATLVIGNPGGDTLRYRLTTQSSETPLSLIEKTLRKYTLPGMSINVPINPDSAAISGRTQVNVQSKGVLAADLTGITIVYDLYHGERDSTYESILINDVKTRGAKVVVNTLPITSSLLDTTSVLWIDDDGTTAFSAAESTVVVNWIKSGGSLFTHSDAPSFFQNVVQPFGITFGGSYVSGYTTNIIPHPITDSVSQIYLSGPMTSCLVSGSAQIIVRDPGNNGHTCIAEPGAGRIVCVVDDDFYNSYITYADNRKFGNNIIDWLARGGASHWLSVQSDSGCIPPAAQATHTVKFTSGNLLSGVYTGSIDITHNAPAVSSPYSVPCTLTVNGFRSLSGSPASLNFGTQWVGLSDTMSLILTNKGNQTTLVSSVASDLAAFTILGSTSFTVQPFKSVTVRIAYKPSVAGNQTGTLKVNSNAQDNPVITVALSGTGITGPQISLSSHSLYRNVAVGDSTSATLTLTNNGGAPLTWTISPSDNTKTTAAPVYDASHFVTLAKGAIDTRIGQPAVLSHGGPDRTGYTWIDSNDPSGPAYQWNDIKATGTMLTSVSSCDDCNQAQKISFKFPFYGATFDTIYVGSNGYITFGAGSSNYTNYPLPSTSAPANLIAGFFDDLNTSAGGDVYFKDYGDRVVVQFDNVYPYSGSGSYTFQIVLDKSGAIYLYYNNLTGLLTSATVGIQNAACNDGLTVAYNTAYLKNALAVKFSPKANWLGVSPLSGTISAGQSASVLVSLNGAAVTAGTYYGTLNISHNDPTQPSPIQIPVTLQVGGSGVMMKGQILSIGVPAIPVVSGSSFRIVNLKIGLPVAGIAQGNKYRLVVN